MLKDYSGPVQAVYGECVDKLLQNIARHVNLAAVQGYSGALDWDVHVLHEMGQLTQENIKIIAASTQNAQGLSEQAIGKAIMDALATTQPELAKAAAAGKLIKPKPSALSASMNKILKAASSQIKKDTAQANKTMLKSSLNGFRQVVANIQAAQSELRETALGVLNTATGEVLTGVTGIQAAVRSAIKQLADDGITGFVDKAGRKWSPEAYVSMDVRTSAAGAAMDASMEQNRQYGVDLVIVPVNATARPKCAPWQGKILSMSGGSGVTEDRDGAQVRYYSISETSYGEPDGLFGINCHHRPPDPFIPGISGQNAKPAADVAERYEQTQEQRKLERDVKKAKREAVALDAAGDKQGFADAAARIREQTAKLKAYCDANDLPYYGDRVQVYGYNRSVSAKANAALKTGGAPVVKAPAAPAVVMDFKNRWEADNYLRPVAGGMWKRLNGSERAAVYDYTCGSGGFNRPLRGYDRTWSQGNYKGIGNVPLDNEGKGKNIKLLEKVIGENELPEAMVLYRDSDEETLERFLGLESGKGRPQYAAEIAKKVVGQRPRDTGFLSVSACEDSSFGQRVLYIVKAPKGTNGIYVEPVSRYNEVSNHGVWDGEESASALGNEMEIILQRNYRYKITKVYEGTTGRGAGRLTVEMEVVTK